MEGAEDMVEHLLAAIGANFEDASVLALLGRQHSQIERIDRLQVAVRNAEILLAVAASNLNRSD